MAQVLILGGTGFIGIPIVECLLSANHKVTIFTRGKVLPTFSRPVEFLQGDRSNSESLRKAVSNRTFDTVIDNLPYVREEVDSAIEIFTDRIQQYVLTSSVVVYGRDFNNPIPENSVNLTEVPSDAKKPEPGKSTTVGKRQCELALWNTSSSKKPPFSFTILRPAKINGPGDPSPRMWWYIQRINDGGPLVLASENPIPFIRHVYSRDLAVAYSQVLLNPRCYGQAYNLAHQEVVSLHDVMELIASALKRELRIERVPQGELEAAGVAQNSNPLVVTGDLIPDISKAQEHFGWNPEPLSHAIAELVEWYTSQPFVQDSWGYDIRDKEIQLSLRCQNQSTTA